MADTVCPDWRHTDIWLFQRLGAGHRAQALALWLAVRVSRWSGLPLLACLLVAGVQGGRGAAVLWPCLPLVLLVQWSCKRLARNWSSPRPFAVGLSPNHLGHSQRGGLPSTHAAVMASVSVFVLLSAQAPGWALGMLAITGCTAWARVYAGAHFPSDVLAGLCLGGVAGASLAWCLPA